MAKRKTRKTTKRRPKKGLSLSVSKSNKRVNSLLEKGYQVLQVPDFKEGVVHVYRKKIKK